MFLSLHEKVQSELLRNITQLNEQTNDKNNLFSWGAMTESLMTVIINMAVQLALHRNVAYTYSYRMLITINDFINNGRFIIVHDYN